MKVTPTLTSNTSNPGTTPIAFANTTDAYKAFDDDTSTSWTVPAGITSATSSFKFWRMDNFVANAWDGWWSIGELQLGNDSQVPYTTGSWTAVTLSRPTEDYNGSSLLKLVDGNVSYDWINLYTSNAPSFWIQWEFPTAVPVAYIRQGGWYGYRFTNSLRLIGSNDGSTWTTVYSGAIDNLNGAWHQANNYANWTSVAGATALGLTFTNLTPYDYYVLRTNDATKAPTDFVFEGLAINDGTNTWSTIDTQTGVSGWVAGTPKVYNLTTNNKLYAGFRLRFTSIPSAGLDMSELSVYRNEWTTTDLYDGGDILQGTVIANTTNPRIEGIYQRSFAADIPIPDSSGGVIVTRPVQGQLYPRGLPNIS